jgi:hypothetical protein
MVVRQGLIETAALGAQDARGPRYMTISIAGDYRDR